MLGSDSRKIISDVQQGASFGNMLSHPCHALFKTCPCRQEHTKFYTKFLYAATCIRTFVSDYALGSSQVPRIRHPSNLMRSFHWSLKSRMSVHEAMQIMKTWTNSWAASVRYHASTTFPCLLGCTHKDKYFGIFSMPPCPWRLVTWVLPHLTHMQINKWIQRERVRVTERTR